MWKMRHSMAKSLHELRSQSGMARVRTYMDQNGPLQAKLDQNGPCWSILVSQMLKSSSDCGHFDQYGCLDHFGPWTHTFRHRGHSSVKSPQIALLNMPENAKQEGQKSGGGGGKPREDTPTENSFRPPSPRHLRNSFRRVSKNGFRRAILARFCVSLPSPPPPP